jgi:hypothetical protein
MKPLPRCQGGRENAAREPLPLIIFFYFNQATVGAANICGTQSKKLPLSCCIRPSARPQHLAKPAVDTHIWRRARVLLQQAAKNAAHVLLWFGIHAHAHKSSRVLSPPLITSTSTWTIGLNTGPTCSERSPRLCFCRFFSPPISWHPAVRRLAAWTSCCSRLPAVGALAYIGLPE